MYAYTFNTSTGNSQAPSSSVTFSVSINEAISPLSVTITGPANSASSLTSTPISAGNRVTVNVFSGGTPGVAAMVGVGFRRT